MVEWAPSRTPLERVVTVYGYHCEGERLLYLAEAFWRSVAAGINITPMFLVRIEMTETAIPPEEFWVLEELPGHHFTSSNKLLTEPCT